MERRDRLEIVAEILRVAMKGAKKTHIVYKANLNHAILGDYLDRLEEQGLITSKIQPGNKVKTTQKGHQFIQKYMSLTQLTCF
jgi:predicted transcriptional regulator